MNSAYNDFCPTPPGGELLFVSTRPGGCGDGTSDIYRTRLHPTDGWLEPEHLGCEVNSAGNEFSPSYVGAGGGALFFSSDRDGGPTPTVRAAREGMILEVVRRASVSRLEEPGSLSETVQAGVIPE